MSGTAGTGATSAAGKAGGGAAATTGGGRPFEERVLAELGALGGAVLESSVQRPRRLLARIRPEAVVEVCRRMKKTGFEHLSVETCVDYESEMEMVYILWSYKESCMLELRSRISGTDPKVASLTPVWTGAEFHEREAYDMFGVVFEGCPNLSRVLLPDEWSVFPLRKSFKVESIHEKRKRLEAEKAKAEKAKAAAAAAAAAAPPPPPPQTSPPPASPPPQASPPPASPAPQTPPPQTPTPPPPQASTPPASTPPQTSTPPASPAPETPPTPDSPRPQLPPPPTLPPLASRPPKEDEAR